MKSSIFIVTFLLFIFSLPDIAEAQTDPKPLKQIPILIKEKETRTPAQQKIDSQLLQALREQKGQSMAPGVGLDSAQVNADRQGNLDVDISADVTDELLARIKALGGRIIYPSKEYLTIRAKINLSMVENIAAYTEVKFIAPAALATTNGSASNLGNMVQPGVQPIAKSPAQDVPVSAPIKKRDGNCKSKGKKQVKLQP